GRPRQMGLGAAIGEWAKFRLVVVERRLKHRANEVADRVHILEGRLMVFARIEEVIKLIRKSDEPKPDLMAKFKLSERQAEDILSAKVEPVVDEPVTVILSRNGFLRTRSGHGIDRGGLGWKEGDAELAIVETRTTLPVVLFGANGRVFNVRAIDLPGGKGDGVPAASLIDTQRT